MKTAVERVKKILSLMTSFQHFETLYIFNSVSEIMNIHNSRVNTSFPHKLVIPAKPRHSRESTSFPRNHVIPAKPRHSRETTSFPRNHVIPAKPRHSRESTSFPRKRESLTKTHQFEKFTEGL